MFAYTCLQGTMMQRCVLGGERYVIGRVNSDLLAELGVGEHVKRLNMETRRDRLCRSRGIIGASSGDPFVSSKLFRKPYELRGWLGRGSMQGIKGQAVFPTFEFRRVSVMENSEFPLTASGRLVPSRTWLCSHIPPHRRASSASSALRTDKGSRCLKFQA